MNKMRLYLVRHGKALSKEQSPQRSLSDGGKREIEKVAAFLKPLGLKVDTIYHSGKARAFETAEILSKSVKSKNGLKKRDDINPNDNVLPIAKEVNGLEKDIMLVGHLPFMGLMASQLMAGDPDAVSVTFGAGGVMCLERGYEKSWSLIWMIAPGLLSDKR